MYAYLQRLHIDMNFELRIQNHNLPETASEKFIIMDGLVIQKPIDPDRFSA